MFFRKYFAFVETTFPWIFCCFLTWWVDRLLVEFGHRATDSPTCTHNNLQYVRWHQFVTMCAVKAQTVHSVLIRKKQFLRELSLMGVIEYRPCLYHLYIVQGSLCVAWAAVIACMVDVSPWLCLPTVVHYRASIATAAVATIFLLLLAERKLWTWTLDRAVRMDPDSIDI